MLILVGTVQYWGTLLGKHVLMIQQTNFHWDRSLVGSVIFTERWTIFIGFLDKLHSLKGNDWSYYLFFFLGGGITFFLCSRPIHNGSHSQIFEITFFFSLETKIDRGTQFAEKRTITITIFTTFLVKIWLNFEKYLVKIVNRGSIDPQKVLFNIFGEKKYGPNPV